MVTDEADRYLPEQREIADGVPSPDPAMIFMGSDVEHPVAVDLASGSPGFSPACGGHS